MVVAVGFATAVDVGVAAVTTAAAIVVIIAVIVIIITRGGGRRRSGRCRRSVAFVVGCGSGSCLRFTVHPNSSPRSAEVLSMPHTVALERGISSPHGKQTTASV